MADFDTNPLEIHYWNDPVLSVVCAPVNDSEFDSRLLDFGQRLIQIMKDKKGVGLAASQVGVCKRVFAMTEEDGSITVGCNPTLSPSKNIVYHKEGCLSVPGIYEVV